ncbi:hypothetical protein DFP73DRAFT_542224 [Morchella snyderi]|nr:hypothetical protein DFP73DRAFT_542224 [Morchella snyderi]
MPYLTAAPPIYTSSITPVNVRITADKTLTHYIVIYTSPPHGAPQDLHDLVNNNLAHERSDTSAQLHLLHPSHPITPLFTVDFHSRGQRYHLVSSRGITQWYTEQHRPGSDTGGSIRRHEFFAASVQSVRWCVWNLLVYLQRAHLCLPMAGALEKGKWWVVNIGLTWGEGPHDPNTRFVTLWVREDTRLARVFEVVACHEVEGWFCLSQVVWGGQDGRPKSWYYDDAAECGVVMKDCGWRGEGVVWLKTQVI